MGAVVVPAQLVVDETVNIKDLVKNLAGPNVEISNIQTSYTTPLFGSSPVGYFLDTYGLLGIDKGLVMTTGAAANTVGPNDNNGIGQANDTISFDSTFVDTVFINEYDLVEIEFDITTPFNQLSFNYVFGSEEYPEFVGSGYDDKFAFYISGPGIEDTVNIAVLEDGTEVSVNSINHLTNTEFYVANGIGETPFINFYTQYDGYTTKLTARSPIIPCETYHIRLAIWDVSDQAFDSGVFIEEGSFTGEQGEPQLSVEYEVPAYEAAIEGCADAYVKIARHELALQNLSQPWTYYYYLQGDATNGDDYTTLLDSIVIPAGDSAASITIEPLVDNVIEGTEVLTIQLYTPCKDLVSEGESIDVILKDEFEYDIPEASICVGDSIQLNPAFDTNTDSLVWNNNTTLSCIECGQPYAKPIVDTTYPVKIIDKVSTCEKQDTVSVSVIDVHAYFTFDTPEDYTSLDIQFENLSQMASSYQWSFGDGEQSVNKNPLHTYPNVDEIGEVSYTISLEASSENPFCTDQFDTLLVIQKPLFIPNVITPNGDDVNDVFKIQGLTGENWVMSIFNRWGDRVYQAENYQHDWDASEVVAGMYYYELENRVSKKMDKGWISVIK